ncbi:Hpt domain-containing protein [Glaciimonas immobilis]|uniref:HPt (Histidine-containing phosphotransfer) domain-containing protein n=1 Tax=Glaciimonas immobilis TaxID=728004 RepID=A0A840RRJ1_9BURK|nr:Hpt domain-containing protein [Glaciimonas immobilis]KAF3999903.1 Hpt domain-containing protein [Glaciimonas immobilis]MBB5200395.1 HPt (histidine-containing phosphotransfer) domain-containing protein [Glaciimonas immobilis]
MPDKLEPNRINPVNNEPIVHEDTELAVLMASLGREYMGKLPAKIAQMHMALAHCKGQLNCGDDCGKKAGDQSTNAEAASTLLRLVHSLSGSAGIFGLEALGKQAGKLEQKLKSHINQNSWSEDALCEIGMGLSELQVHASIVTIEKRN